MNYKSNGKGSFPCTVSASNVAYNPKLSAYGFRNNFQYIDLFNYYILSIIQKGLETEWFDPKHLDVSCDAQKADAFKEFSYKDVISLFVIFIFGSSVAVIYTAIEYWHAKRKPVSRTASTDRQNLMDKEMQKLKVFDVKAKQVLEKIESTFRNSIHRSYQEENLDFDSVLCKANQRYVNMENDLEYNILKLLYETEMIARPQILPSPAQTPEQKEIAE
jgi:hypothetical protein